VAIFKIFNQNMLTECKPP